ncbi:MAG: hypothetical protein DRN03_03500, partial [Thermoplasmata archaeon]
FKNWIVKYKSGSTWKSYNSTNNPITITINKPHVLTAVFVTEPGKSSLTVVARMHCGYIMYGIKVSYRVNSGKWKTGKTSFTISNLKKGDKVELKLAESFPFEWCKIIYRSEDFYGFSWSDYGKTGELGNNPTITVDWEGDKKVYAVFKQKGAPSELGDFKLTLTVYVKDYDTNEPIERAKVVLSSPAMDSNPDTVDPDPFIEYTDSQGKVVFRVGKVPITVEASKDNYESTNDPNKPSKWSGTISKDTTITLYLRRKKTYTLTVYVKDYTFDKPIEGAKVVLNNEVTKYTDSEGKVKFEGLKGGEWLYVKASKEGYEDTSDPSKPSSWRGKIDSDTTITLYLKGKLKLTIKAIHTDYVFTGGSIPGLPIKVNEKLFYTDRRGKVSLSVGPGTYTIEVLEKNITSSGYQKYVFYKWGDGNKRNPRTFTINEDTTITVYALHVCKVVITADQSLTTNPSVGTHWYPRLYPLKVSASPSDKFGHWEVKPEFGNSYTSTDNPLDLTHQVGEYRGIIMGYDVYAKAKPEVELIITVKYLDYRENVVSTVQNKRVEVDGTTYKTDSSGRISISVSVGEHEIYIPEEYRVKEDGVYWQKYYFAKWSDNNKQNPRTFSITDDTEIVVYVWRECKVVIGSDPELTVSPRGEHWYKYKYSLSISASPDSKFDYWSIAEHPGSKKTSTNNPLSLTITRGYEVYAHAKQQPSEHTLTIYTKWLDYRGNVRGIVPYKDVYIDGKRYETDRNGVLRVKVEKGKHTIEVLSPEYYSDWERDEFAEWSDGNKDNPRTITIDKDTTLTAYLWREHKVVITSDPELDINPGGAKWYKYDQTISIKASPNDKFDYWTITPKPTGNSWRSRDNPLSLTIDKGYQIHAHAKQEPEKVSLTVTVKYLDYRGRVVSIVRGKKVLIDGTEYKTDSSGRVSVTVNAGSHTIEIPEEYRVWEDGKYWQKYYFAKWSDGSKNNPRSFNINDDTELIVYVWRKCRVVIGGAPELTVSPSETKWYKYKYPLSIKASPNDKFAFWSITEHPGTSRTSTQNPLSLTITRGYEVYAHAKQQSPPPPPPGDATYKLRVYCYYLDYRGKVISTIWGKSVVIDGKTYATNRYGYVEVKVSKGYHTIEIPKQTHWRGYQQYEFAKWSDGSTSNPRRVYVNKDTTLKAYCWRYCKVIITAEPPLKTSPSDTRWYKWNYPLSIKASPSDKFERWVVTPEVGNAFTSTRNPLWLRVKMGYNVKAEAKDEVELTVTVKYLDYRGRVISTVWGMPVKIDG